jgi:hypothetical protein
MKVWRVVMLFAVALATGAPLTMRDAHAQETASGFLERMQGEYRGRGSALIPGRSKPERILCAVTNSFEAASGSLVVEGECASAQGKTKVRGEMTADGARVSGMLLGSVEGARVTRSGGSLVDGALVVQTSFMENATGNLTETRQVMRIAEGGFDAEFYTLNRRTKEYERSGAVQFRQAGDASQ